MASLMDRIPEVSPRNETHRMARAGAIVRRLPIELSRAVLTLRTQRESLREMFSAAVAARNVADACRISSELVKIVGEFRQLNSLNERRTRASKWGRTLDIDPVDLTPPALPAIALAPSEEEKSELPVNVKGARLLGEDES